MPIPDSKSGPAPGDSNLARDEATPHGGIGEGTHWLPEGTSVVALVRERGGGAWAAGVAVGLADIVGRRRGRTFLANTIPGATELDGLMEAADLPGLTVALSGEMTVSAIARSAPRQSFAYLPAGTPALPLGRLREIPAFRSLLRRVAEHGGTLLLYVAEEALDEDGGPGPDHDLPVDGCIAIGEVEDLALTVGAPLLARVERPSTAREASTQSGAEEPDPTVSDETLDSPARVDEKSSDRRGSVPAWAPWLGVAAGLMLAWLAWGSFDKREAGGNQAGSDGGAPAVVAADVGLETGVQSSARAAEPEAEAGDSGAISAESEFSGPDLPYSVLVASFALPEDANRQLRELSMDELLLFVAPTPIRGRTYYRILAGAREDRLGAEALMRELVDAGVKEQLRAWDVRPVRFSYELGTYSERREADRRVDELQEAGISAYRLEGGTEQEPNYRVYSGAYESDQAAEVLGRALEDAGESARLVTRKGRTR
jgi:cell division septation protein DedD